MFFTNDYLKTAKEQTNPSKQRTQRLMGFNIVKNKRGVWFSRLKNFLRNNIAKSLGTALQAGADSYFFARDFVTVTNASLCTALQAEG